MNSVGSLLRSARERQGRAVADIADELCLTQQYLRSIEADDVKNLPGVFFYKNFVRQYAAIVGVKESEIRAGVEALAAAAEQEVAPGAPPQPPLRPLDPIVADSNRRNFAGGRMGVPLAGLVAVLVACSGFYAWWTRPADLSAAKPQPAPAVAQPVPPPPSAIQDSKPQDAPIVPVADSSRDLPAAVAVTTAHTQTVDGVNQVVLNLAATEKTWLSITSD